MRSPSLPRLGACALALACAAGCPRDRGPEPPPHHYEDKEAALARFEVPDRDAWAQPGKVVEMLHLTPGMDVADIGAGSGYFTRRLAHAAPAGTTYAVDVDADFKDHIESHLGQWGTPNIVTRLAVYEHPLLPQSSVDFVFISNTYSFLQDRERYFTAVHKALRPGGRVALIDWRVDADCQRETGCPKPNQRVPLRVVRRETAAVGFVVLEEYEFLEYQYFMILGRAEDVRRQATPPRAEPDTASATPEPAGSDEPGQPNETAPADRSPE